VSGPRAKPTVNDQSTQWVSGLFVPLEALDKALWNWGFGSLMKACVAMCTVFAFGSVWDVFAGGVASFRYISIFYLTGVCLLIVQRLWGRSTSWWSPVYLMRFCVLLFGSVALLVSWKPDIVFYTNTIEKLFSSTIIVIVSSFSAFVINALWS
jgi:hypothetical protein